MDDADVINAVRDLVERGEYRDEIPGVPGARLSGGGVFRGDRRLYSRASPEYLDARAAGLTERLPQLPIASRAAVDEAEAVIGSALPDLLRRLYLEIGNGGFGPGYGVLGVGGGHVDEDPRTAVDLFWLTGSEEHDPWRGPPGATLLPICNWGCGIYSFVDCSSPEARMWAWDPNPVPPKELSSALFPEDVTLVDWLGRWIELRLNQPAAVQDVVTGRWRGATEAEHAEWAAELAQD